MIFPENSVSLEELLRLLIWQCIQLKPQKNQVLLFMTIPSFRAYNYKIVAEGVETREQFDQLKDLGIDFVQGYYFSIPVLPGDLLEYPTEYKTLTS